MTLRVVQVGMGNWGRNWAKNIILRNKDVELVACVDMDADIFPLVQKELDLPAELCFATLEEALASREVDAVIVTASLPGHIPSTLTALSAGKHVLLEKPFAATLAEAQRIVKLAAERECVLMISQNYRFYPAVQTVTRLVRESTLGPVGSIHLDFRRYANTASPEGHRHYHIWQPLLVDMAIHHFDLMRLVLGQEAEQVSCHTWNPTWSKFDEPPCAAATITFNGGTVINYRGSWVSMGPRTSWSGEWHMECEKGEIAWSSRDDSEADYVTLRPLGKPAQHIQLPEMPFIDRHGSLHAFVEAISTGQEPDSTGRDNLDTLALMLAAIESSTSGTITRLSR